MAKRPSKTCQATSRVAVAVDDVQSNVVGSAFVATRMAPPACAWPDAGAPDAHHIKSGTTPPATIRATTLVRIRHHPPQSLPGNRRRLFALAGGAPSGA